ncbi:hypothetical protein RQP46_005093 [Phenoliferia psychrophenolica]
MKHSSRLFFLSFFESQLPKGPLAELVGTRRAIEEGLRVIRDVVEREIVDKVREGEVGDVGKWTSFGEEFLEDLGCTEEEWRKGEKERMNGGVHPRERDAAALVTGNGNGNGYSNGRGDPAPHRSLRRSDPPSPNSSRAPLPPSHPLNNNSNDTDEIPWRASRWPTAGGGGGSHANGGPISPPRAPAPRPGPTGFHHHHPPPPPTRDIPYVRQHGDPTFSLPVPRISERHLLGQQGSFIKSLEQTYKTPVFLERSDRYAPTPSPSSHPSSLPPPQHSSRHPPSPPTLAIARLPPVSSSSELLRRDWREPPPPPLPTTASFANPDFASFVKLYREQKDESGREGLWNALEVAVGRKKGSEAGSPGVGEVDSPTTHAMTDDPSPSSSSTTNNLKKRSLDEADTNDGEGDESKRQRTAPAVLDAVEVESGFSLLVEAEQKKMEYASTKGGMRGWD